MSATSSSSPSSDSGDGLKIRVYRVRLTAWAQRFANKVDASGGPDACWPWTGQYVNIAKNALHLWCCLDGEVLPDFRVMGAI